MIRFFYYLTPDLKAMEAELNRLAALGWELRWLHCGLARFRKTDRRDLRYSVEFRLTHWDREEHTQDEYLQLCDDAGWELARDGGAYRIFRSRPGVCPAPIQTDPALDFELNWKGALRQLQWSALIPLLCLLLNITLNMTAIHHAPFHLWQALLSMGNLIFLLLLILYLILFVVYFTWLCCLRRRYRRAAEGGAALPAPSRRGARSRGLAYALAMVLLLLALLVIFLPDRGYYNASSSPENTLRMASLPVVRAQDLGYPKNTGSNFLRVEGSPFLRHISAMDFAGSGNLIRTEWYQTRSPWLAERVALSLLADEGDGEDLHFHAPIELSPIPSEFDQAWLYQGPDGWQSLLLRQGNLVASVEGMADLTDPDILSTLRVRLQLK